MVKFCYASFNLIHTANYSNGYRSDFSTLGDTKHTSVVCTIAHTTGFLFPSLLCQCKHTGTHTLQGQSEEGNHCTWFSAASTSLQSNLNRAGTSKLSHQGSACLPPSVLRTSRMQKTRNLMAGFLSCSQA